MSTVTYYTVRAKVKFMLPFHSYVAYITVASLQPVLVVLEVLCWLSAAQATTIWHAHLHAKPLTTDDECTNHATLTVIS